MVKQIDRDAVRAFVAEGAQLVEVLPQAEYQDGTCRGRFTSP